MTPNNRAMVAGVAYFAMVFATGFAFGVIRVVLLVPRLGARSAELFEMPIMLAVVLLSARFVVRRCAIEPGIRSRLLMGGFAIALAIVAELLVAVGLQNQSLIQYLAAQDPVSGRVFAVMLVMFAAAPLILSRFELRAPLIDPPPKRARPSVR